MTPDTRAGKLVLVVDDEIDFLATYERLLRRQGCDVITATTRVAGIDAVGRMRPHLVISDVRLPDGSGLDVVRAARGVLNPPAVIVVTGYPSEQNRRAALAAGASVFLSKPFAASALMAAVQSGLADGRDARV
jgi:DNA-binding response OmpR family regulator